MKQKNKTKNAIWYFIFAMTACLIVLGEIYFVTAVYFSLDNEYHSVAWVFPVTTIIAFLVWFALEGYSLWHDDTVPVEVKISEYIFSPISTILFGFFCLMIVMVLQFSWNMNHGLTILIPIPFIASLYGYFYGKNK